MSKQNKNGMTIIEVLVVIAIIAILMAGLYSAGTYADKQARIKYTESTIEILSVALEQYRDFYGKFPFQAYKNYGEPNLQSDMGGTVVDKNGNPLSVTDYNNLYASSEALYYFLNKAPDAKKIVASLNPSLVTNKGDNGKEYFIKFGSDPTPYPLIHIIDAWKSPFRYTYNTGDNFPVITSAGPNRVFEPNSVYIDDITSR